ncbi:MAG TPA: thioredoxin family protein [Polyangiaceae bacterium]|nr:thioredoxin family protein [Polyangiaceae bacterium]
MSFPRVGLALLFCVALGCGARQPPADARTTVLSLRQLDCSSCGDQLVEKMKQEDGVVSAKFDRRSAELTVVAAPSYDPLARANELKGDEKYEVVEGSGQGVYLPWTKAEAGDVSTLAADGKDLPDLQTHVVAGKVTVFDFGAIWCEPCRMLDEHMLGVIKQRPDVAYRKLDVGDWYTPLAKRYLTGVQQLPYVIIYGKKGDVVGQIVGLDLKGIDAAIAKGTE